VALVALFAWAAPAFALVATAHAHHPTASGATARIAQAAEPIVADIAIDPAWPAVADQLARDFAAAAGYGDACAGQPITTLVLVNADELAGRDVDGFAYFWDCAFSIDIAATVSPARYCNVYVHERLHLARGDGWHEPYDHAHPLFSDGTTGGWYQPCIRCLGAAVRGRARDRGRARAVRVGSANLAAPPAMLAGVGAKLEPTRAPALSVRREGAGSPRLPALEADAPEAGADDRPLRRRALLNGPAPL
jgi:hypothetical protein